MLFIIIVPIFCIEFAIKCSVQSCIAAIYEYWDKEERDARIASPQLRFHWDSYNIHNTYRGGLNERNNELKRDEKSSAAWVYVHIHIVLEILTNHEFHINFTFLAYALEKNGGDIFCACWTFTVNNRVHISTVKAVFDHALTSIARPPIQRLSVACVLRMRKLFPWR